MENLDFLGFNEIHHAASVKWLVINGNKYITEKSMILAKVLNGNMPEFGLVKNIYLVDSRLNCLEYQPFQTTCFDRNVMAYQAEVPHLAQATELADAEKLVNCTSYYTISSKSQTYLISSHLIFVRLSGVGSRGEQLKQGAPDFPFPGHINQL